MRKCWADCRDEIVVFSVRYMDFMLYLRHLGNASGSKSAVEDAVNSVGWVHQFAVYPAVSESPFVLDGMQRKLAKAKERKEPVTTDMMSTLVNSLGGVPSLTDVQLVAACVLAFSAFLRYDEPAKLPLALNV